ncbi:hypothetical protein OSB04_017665 [Centaurea solstitialis]|uniref:TIR domain-containing protein n=1 Tax=Centaurea solstitialis TaxID=347529 RepID=A0AA38T3A4_9ASTR|nr:hypothetical protein OSB04_017665 [Centaurea solstitialis]
MDLPRRSPKLYSLKLRNTSPRPPRCHYDVFLSFRGEDTRKTFTDSLYKALIGAGIHTFRDDDELPRGNDISSELIKAIQESRASIVVFSKDYASSRWCLAELVKILECRRSIDQLVFPMFYDVDRDDVRGQTGSFGSAFARHEERFDRDKVEEWRSALTEAASLDGWELSQAGSRLESEFVQSIVTKVLHQVKRRLFVTKHPIGLDSRIEELKSLLKDGSDDGCVIGVYGANGIGKTTIVKEFYNTIIQKYEGGCFLANVREKSKRFNGLVGLQKELLYELQGKSHEIGDTNEGISMIKVKLRFKRVLVVLDDVDELSQLDSLNGRSSWFGKGSTIILTTRSVCILDQANVGLRYKVKELNDEESLMLFCWHAFGNYFPLQSHKDISIDIVKYSGRVPLDLEVIGSSLVRKTMDEWKSMLEKLKKKSTSFDT